MKHLDDAMVLSLRDGEPLEPTSLQHAHECDGCTEAVAEVRDRATLVKRALSTLDQPVDLEAAKAAVRARLDASRDLRTGRRAWTGHLGRAAVILLLAAGAVSALPGSPIRRLWERGPEERAPAPSGTAAAVPGPEATGITVPVPGGRIRIVVRDAAPGSELEVTWGDAPTARITAPAGSSFAYADGRAEVVPAAGDLRVELPRTADAASVEVDGSTYLSGSAGRPVISGPLVDRTAERIRFRVPGH